MKGRIIGLILWIALIMLSLLTSCTPEKRLKRLLKNNPNLITTVETTISDTVFTKSFHVDTLKLLSKSDTFFITKNNLITKVFYHNNTDTIRVIQTQKSDTLIKKITIPAKVVYLTDEKFKTYFFASIIGILSFVAFAIAKKYAQNNNGNNK